MEADLYNLVPSVGAINAIRSNFSMSNIEKGRELCSRGLFIKARKVMPPLNRKGDVARIYQYMDLVYPGRGIISKKNRKLFSRWSSLDPIDKVECENYKKKKSKQMNINLILEKTCQNL
jgi:deoxyribonuclease-1